MNIILKYTKRIGDFACIHSDMTQEFGVDYQKSVSDWCRYSPEELPFWRVWIIENHDKVVGTCSLYSLTNTCDELWLGWFGIIESEKGKKIGREVLIGMKNYAKGIGCKELFCYVDKDGPLNFYYKHGFEFVSSTDQYIYNNPEVPDDEMGDPDDVVICCKL